MFLKNERNSYGNDNILNLEFCFRVKKVFLKKKRDASKLLGTQKLVYKC